MERMAVVCFSGTSACQPSCTPTVHAQVLADILGCNLSGTQPRSPASTCTAPQQRIRNYGLFKSLVVSPEVQETHLCVQARAHLQPRPLYFEQPGSFTMHGLLYVLLHYWQRQASEAGRLRGPRSLQASALSRDLNTSPGSCSMNAALKSCTQLQLI